MEKVKVTREQAEAIERARGSYFIEDIVRAHVKGLLQDGFKNLELNKLIKALYIGYEVEPEFKVGDWVTDRDEERNVTGIITRIDKEERLVWGYFSYHDKETNFDFWEIRHATPSEIAEEKERRWWRKHGREPWELKTGDVLWDPMMMQAMVVDHIVNKREVHFSDGDWDDLKEMRGNYTVVAFVENRLDREGGE